MKETLYDRTTLRGKWEKHVVSVGRKKTNFQKP